MLRHPTIETLQTLKLTGMATALAEQLAMPEVQHLSFEARLGLLVDRELTTQENRRLARRLAKARFRLPAAALEDLDARAPRGLDPGLIASLATGQWIRTHDNVPLCQDRCRAGFSQIWGREMSVSRGNASEIFTSV